MREYTLERFQKEIAVRDYIRDYVNVEEFLECCRVCPNYNTVWSCPPYDFAPVKDYWEKYESLEVHAYKINFPEGITYDKSEEIMHEVKKKLTAELFALEEENPGSVSLSAGNCLICGKGGCNRSSGQPCRHPDKMRYSIESIGGNVGKTVHDLLKLEIEWVEEGKMPSYYILVGGLLKK